MRKFMAGVAAIAMLTSAAIAQPGGGKGNGGGGGGKGGGGGHAAHAPGGGGGGQGGGKAQGGGKERGGGGHAAFAGSSGNGGGKGRGGGNDRPRAERQEARGPGASRGNADRGPKAERAQRAENGGGRGHSNAMRNARGPGNGQARVEPGSRGKDRAERGPGAAVNGRIAERGWRAPLVNVGGERRSNWLDGCPPGLAKKNNGCVPPGQIRPANASYWQPTWYGADRWGAGDWRYYDGYMLRMNADRILGYVPLLGGALAVGSVWPGDYAPVGLPDYYRSYYGLGDDDWRYYDDTIYRVDPQTSAIQSIAALLTGDPFAIGQPLPAGYDIYNVPYGFRDQYMDDEDSLYRYADGYVYQVDPTTQLVQAAIQLLT